MVEKIELLDKLSKVELIKLLNLDNMKLEKLLDLKIKIDEELDSKYDNIDKIELKKEFNNFYNLELSDKYNKLFSNFSSIDLLKLINLEDMDFCELLYLDVLVKDAIDKRLIIEDDFYLNGVFDSFTLLGNDLCSYEKIKFINDNDLIFGLDKKYNFYIGKIDKDMRCILFCILRKGLPYDISNDVFVFDGIITSDKRLDGFWLIGIGELDKAVEKIKNMDNDYNYQNFYENKLDSVDLNTAYIACNNTNSVGCLLDEIRNKKINRTFR